MAHEQAILAGGCFWCTEAVFNDVIGVTRVESGYTGGHVPDPSYKAGVRRRYRPRRGDPAHLRSGRDLLRRHTRPLLRDHDPTQLNRQGNDIGTQYRSAIFPLSPEQEAAARRAMERARADWPGPIVTSIEPLGEWYPAEDYHQDYWAGEGQRNPYCLAIIPPKLKKLRKSFAHRVKSEASSPA
jgi:peptide-methionine (S)-S-oxide reductase